MHLNLTQSLPSLVKTKFNEAKASEALIMSATEVDVIRTSAGIPFQLRYCPSLAKKPEPQKEKNNEPKKKFDPFENPSPSLFITDIPANNTTVKPSHILVLNKYPVIRNHFILATKENKPQTHRLEEDDLAATYACLKAWEEYAVDDPEDVESSTRQKNERRLFAFFNSGEFSGASQPHRHLQFLPVEDMRSENSSDATEEGRSWDLLVDTILSDGAPLSSASLPQSSKNQPMTNNTNIAGIIHHPALPFIHYAHKFTSDPSGPELAQIYNTLYHLAREAVEKNNTTTTNTNTSPPSTAPESSSADLPIISYNLALTTAGIAILPRRSEAATLRTPTAAAAEIVGHVQLNGTALGGTLLVKRVEEWDALRRSRGSLLDRVLSDVGIPNPYMYPSYSASSST